MKRPVYIIGEIGINFNGDLNNCFKLIDKCADAGCNAAKFQFFSGECLYPRSAGRLDWKNGERKYSYDIYDTVKSFELPGEWLDKIIGHCEKRKIDFMSSVFDLASAKLLVDKGIKSFKIASYCLTHVPLIEYCASFNIPMFISTGGSMLGEIEEAAAAVLKHHKKIYLLHCSIKYPTELKECNLGVLDTLKTAFPETGTGYSDHTFEVSEAPVQAVYLGAGVIEKHITLDKKMKGPDHFFALEPHELKEMVAKIRKAEIDLAAGNFTLDKKIYGSTGRIVYDHEKYLRDFAFMSMFAARDIRCGEIIKKSDIKILRPGKKAGGLMPKYLKLFDDNEISAKIDIKFESPITWRCIL